MAHHKKKFTPPKHQIKTTFDAAKKVIYEVVVWNGVKEKIAQFLYKDRAEMFYQKVIDAKERCVVTLRKIEDFGRIVISSIVKEWEVV